MALEALKSRLHLLRSWLMALLIMKRSGLGAGIREERIEKAKN